SRGYVALPASLRASLTEWKSMQKPGSDDEFMFPNCRRGVHRVDNYRADVLRPALNKIAEETGIGGIDFRACRRTCATHLSRYGGSKKFKHICVTRAQPQRSRFTSRRSQKPCVRRSQNSTPRSPSQMTARMMVKIL